MDTTTIVLLMLLLVVASGLIVRMIPWMPLPLIQIFLGAVISTFMGFHVTLLPSVFFLLLLPPLLFLDGWRIPKMSMMRDRWPILALAVGLVVFTVVGMGYLLHWMIPKMPLTVAFALAAVLSPTDAVAVSSIAKRVRIPERMVRILEGESLLNDASGLVCLRFAIAATLTGAFNITDAIATFSWLAVGGVVTGIIVTLSWGYVKNWVARRYGEETGTEVLISLLIPFGAYLAAEHLECSGILAAVSAGMAMSYVERSGQALALTRVRRTAVWNTIQFAINGIIFVLLGQQWPSLTQRASKILSKAGENGEWLLAMHVGVTFLGLILLRFIWVWISLHFANFYNRIRQRKQSKPSFRLIAVMSFAGVRGAITLAGILTLPIVLNNGAPFPARDLAIFIAASVTVLSIVVASVALPILMRGAKIFNDSHDVIEEKARLAAAKAALMAIEEEQHRLMNESKDIDFLAQAGAEMMSIYQRRLDAENENGIGKEDFRRRESVERRLRLAGLRAERSELFRMARAKEIDDNIAHKLIREIDLIEYRYSL